MAKKRTGLSQTLFSGIDPYSKEQERQAERAERLVYLPLAAIRPDPDQPRRLLPGNLQAKLEEQREYDPLAVMHSWLTEATSGDARLKDLRKLADSIARHGLINPITVRPLATPRPDGTQYLIVTGERRYWAHGLLAVEGRHLQVGERRDPGQIQSLLAPEGISVRAHQLVENINREDINALEKAYGLVALRYELSEVNPGSPSSPIDTGVNRGSPSPNLVPWTEVSDVMGISKRYRIYITSVLDLCDEAQAIIAAHNLAEKTVRPIVQKLKEHPGLQVEALQQLVTWQRENEAEEGVDRAINNKAVGDLVTRLLARENKSARRPRIQVAPHTHKFQSNVRRTLQFLNKLKTDDLVLVARDLALDQTYQETVQELQDLQAHLEQVLRQVEDYRSEV